MAKPKKHIYVGKEYGWLTVLGEAPKDKSGHIMWRVRCRCGKEYNVTTSRLGKKDSKCRECTNSLGNHKRIYHVGDVINGWEIISEVGKSRQGSILYICKCPICKSCSVHSAGDLSSRKGKGCQNCKPEYHFEIQNDVAVGILPSGDTFKIDVAFTEVVSKHHWHLHNGYIICTDRHMNRISLHRYIVGLRKSQDYVIDHINRDRTDCRLANLRFVTQQQNAMNRGMSRNNTSRYVGVCYLKTRRLYIATIGLNYKRITIGTSINPVECAQMYNYASELLFGEYVGYRNKVSPPSEKLKEQVEERCRPYTNESFIARRTVVLEKMA